MAGQIPEGNGRDVVRWRLDHLDEEVRDLWNKKASVEAVMNLTEAIKGLREEFKDDVKGLRKILITAALGWVAGSGMFLLAVLTLTRGG